MKCDNTGLRNGLADLETGDSAAFARVSTRREGFDDGMIILVVVVIVGPRGEQFSRANIWEQEGHAYQSIS
jgi:hypothetical protein